MYKDVDTFNFIISKKKTQKNLGKDYQCLVPCESRFRNAHERVKKPAQPFLLTLIGLIIIPKHLSKQKQKPETKQERPNKFQCWISWL